MKKDSWIISTEQLEEWKEAINENDIEVVKGQIEDILNQCYNN